MKLFFILFALILPLMAKALDDEHIVLSLDPIEASKDPGQKNKLTPEEVFHRTQLVYQAFGYTPEADYSSDLTDLNHLSSWGELQSVLKYFDPTGTFLKFLAIEGQKLTWYQDANSKKIIDSSLILRSASQQVNGRRWFAYNSDQPLKGLRIALDPGHMGGRTWDVRLGKYINGPKGILSEGILNLQICLLLKQQLEALGANVMVTHEDTTAVSAEEYEKYDLKKYAREEFFMSSQQDWFVNLLTGSSQAQNLKSVFEQSAAYRQLFSENQRSEYYAKRVDVYARAEIIERFRPDITIVVHLDTGGDSFAVNPGSPNAAKAYVPGGYEKMEFPNREQRSYFVRNWVDQERWRGSVRLSRLLLGQLNKQMGIGLQASDGARSTKIEEGLFARNLMIPRRMKTGVVAYMECLFYDRPQEYRALTDYKYNLQIGAVSYPYSDRLRQIVSSLRDGVIEYAKTP